MPSPILLVIDDGPRTEVMIRQAFAASKVSVVFLKDPTEALDYYKQVSVILCSIQLVDCDGYQLASRLCDSHPSAALFMLAEENEKYDALLGRSAGAIGVFTKPFDQALLLSRLEEFLQEDDLNEADDYLPPPMNDRIARLVNYCDDFSDYHEIESIIRELLPPTVEKILQIQLSHNPKFQAMIQRVAHEIIEREVSNLINSNLNKVK